MARPSSLPVLLRDKTEKLTVFDNSLPAAKPRDPERELGFRSQISGKVEQN